MTTLSLDAKEILAYLNELGFRNVTAEQLKEFMQDLRKLIKYEERLCVYNQENKTKDRYYESSDNLHKAHTFSFKTKTAPVDAKKAPEVCKKGLTADDGKIPKNQKKTISEKNGKSKNKDDKEIEEKKTVDGENRPSRKSSLQDKQSDKSSSNPSNRMWIRPKSITRSQVPKTKDPVQLYHYYQKEWEKFKQNLPGENDHSELRWRIRNKLLGVGN